MYDLRNMLLEHKRLFGTHVQLADHRICELLGASGYDFLWIDTEHTSTDYQVLEAHLISARAGGLPAIVRVPWNDHVLVKRVLDMGPDGIVFPMINSVAEARRAIASCIYPPEGTRSYGPVRAMRYGTESLTDLLKDPYGGPVRLLQVESASAVGQLADIAAVPGVDGFILGPMDLSGSIGRLGQLDGPTDELIEQAIRTAHACGKPIGVSTGADDEGGLSHWLSKDLDIISAGSDMGHILHGALRTSAILRAHRAE